MSNVDATIPAAGTPVASAPIRSNFAAIKEELAALQAKVDALDGSTAAGRALLTSADAAVQRDHLGLGGAALKADTHYAPAAHGHEATAITDSSVTGRAILTGDAAAGRAALGLADSESGSGSGDPYWDAVTLLISRGPEKEAPYLTDSSPVQHVLEWWGWGSAWSLTQRLAGESTLGFLTTYDYAASTSGRSLFSGYDDFTVEGFFLMTSTGSLRTILSVYSTDGGVFNIEINAAGRLGFYIRESVPSYFESTNTVTLNEWNHFAVCKGGPAINLFINGTRGLNAPFAAYIGSGNFIIGSNYNNSENFVGYLAQMRVTRGHARYVENFTPPLPPFPSGH